MIKNEVETDLDPVFGDYNGESGGHDLYQAVLGTAEWLNEHSMKENVYLGKKYDEIVHLIHNLMQELKHLESEGSVLSIINPQGTKVLIGRKKKIIQELSNELFFLYYRPYCWAFSKKQFDPQTLKFLASN